MGIKQALYNPATGEEIGKKIEHSLDDLKEAISLSRNGQRVWSCLPIKKRSTILRRIIKRMHENSNEISKTISSSTGKTIIDALSTEVIPGMIGIRYYCRIAHKVLRPEKVKRSSIVFINKRSVNYHEPMGVVGIIGPWNYPFAIPFYEVIMALLAGNGVILKVATQTQLVGEIIKDLLSHIGLPRGLFALIHIEGKIAGDAFLDSGIDKLFFTGSVSAGKNLMARAAKTLTPVCLELGGNDPMIVLEDANIKRAVYGAVWAGISNCGQSCGGVERIYVHEKIYKEFSLKLKDVIEKLRQGYGKSQDFDFGSLTTEKQKRRVELHLEDALEKGADILCSTPVLNGKGYFHPAVVLENVTPSMLVLQEETFGPLLALDRFEDDEEALAKANISNLGLTASVWTSNKKKAQYFAGKLKAGTITINDHLMTHGMQETPWGGFKDSGIGRTHGKEGLLEMTQTKSVTKELFPGIDKNLWWHPHSNEVMNDLNRAMDFLFGKNKIKDLIGLARILTKRLR